KVSLRLRQARNPKMSYYYLDFYPPVFNPATRQTRRHEYLQISRYNEPENQIERDHNHQVDLKAEAIRSQREIEIINMEYGLFDSRVLKDDFLEFFRNEAETKHSKWHAACEHFTKYTHGKCTFGNISIELCEGFKDYLLNEATNRRTGEIINVNSASAYYCMLKCAMRDAYKAKKLKFNPNDYLDKIPTKQTRRPFLTIEEVKALKNTPCDYDVLKNASMFAILTGLRRSDIITLKWEDIVEAPDGGPCIIKRIVKGDRDEIIYISDEALSYCGKRYDKGQVFPGLTKIMTDKPLKRWLKRAGITKDFTFHCFRHTYATLQLAGGTDIFTVSHQLTHRFVSTTQIYADLVDEKRRASANALTLLNNGNKTTKTKNRTRKG
ncbi:MAG: site-specific integrase, partial [Bacteroidales bacterium]|nr:site-specific integrase [Candidatus Cacconaster merdequi]